MTFSQPVRAVNLYTPTPRLFLAQDPLAPCRNGLPTMDLPLLDLAKLASNGWFSPQYLMSPVDRSHHLGDFGRITMSSSAHAAAPTA